MQITFEDFVLKYKDEYILEIKDYKIDSNNFQLAGQNGSGKSSILKVLYKVNEKYQGFVYLNGKEMKKYSKKDIRETISFVSQDYTLYEKLTVKQNIELLSKKKKETLELIYMLNPKIEIKKKVSELSGGQKQVINFCIEYTKESKMLFLDEVFNHLDKDVAKKIKKLISEDEREKILITHKDTFEYADKYIVEDREIKHVQ